MLSRDDNRLLTEVERGTKCGDWLRSFWWPFAISDRWSGAGGQLQIDEPMSFRGRAGTPTSFGRQQANFTGEPLPVRLLGEDLVLYRDLGGTLGLLGISCPHR